MPPPTGPLMWRLFPHAFRRTLAAWRRLVPRHRAAEYEGLLSHESARQHGPKWPSWQRHRLATAASSEDVSRFSAALHAQEEPWSHGAMASNFLDAVDGEK